jgi:hypothetical protein
LVPPLLELGQCVGSRVPRPAEGPKGERPLTTPHRDLGDRHWTGHPARRTASDLRTLPHDQVRRRGTGLGLAICRDIVGAYEGRLQVDSKVGTGTTITLELRDAR